MIDDLMMMNITTFNYMNDKLPRFLQLYDDFTINFSSIKIDKLS